MHESESDKRDPSEIFRLFNSERLYCDILDRQYRSLEPESIDRLVALRAVRLIDNQNRS
jgi:hypothetical protein